ncbi:MAG: hypothetical protein HS129_04925 [Leptospiraceae bacterium]|nr:hypothetical protein [Leptospiraceae bacterium]NUM42904.1 hypothetical protein [Leptospiraceae bacterium]
MTKKYSATNFQKKRAREVIVKNHFEKLNAIRIAYNENMSRWHERLVMIFFRLGGYRNKISSYLTLMGAKIAIQFLLKILLFFGFVIFLYFIEFENKWVGYCLYGIMLFFFYTPFFAISQFIQSFASLKIDIVSDHPPIINVYSYGAWYNGVAMFFYKRNYDLLGAIFALNSEREIDACKTLVYSNKVTKINERRKK